MTTLAIVAAMAQELQGLKDHLSNSQCTVLAGRQFWSGQILGQDVVLVLAKIGKVAAATTTTLLIQHFKVKQIFFTGVAGGLGPQVQVGDLVIGKELLQHDMNASPLFPAYEIPLYGKSYFATHSALQTCLQQACEQVIKQLQTNIQSTAELQALKQGLKALQLDTPHLWKGLIVSGDQFVSSQATSLDLQKNLPKALAVEMEGAAVAQVCHDFDIPLAVLRIISDKANDSAHLDFQQFIEQVARYYSVAVVLHFIALLQLKWQH